MTTILEPTIFELSSPGRRGVKMPASDVPEVALPPKDLLRSELPLPELAEVDVVRGTGHVVDARIEAETRGAHVADGLAGHDQCRHGHIVGVPTIRG